MRVEITSCRPVKKESLNLEQLPKHHTFVVSETSHLTFVKFRGELSSYDEVKALCAALKNLGLVLRCINIYAQEKLPRMYSHGFSHNGLFYEQSIDGVSVLAIPYGPHEWVLQIARRNGFGISLHTLDALPYYGYAPKQLDLLEGLA